MIDIKFMIDIVYDILIKIAIDLLKIKKVYDKINT